MCDSTVTKWFFDTALENPEQFRNKRILEVGSRDVNGSVRHFIEKLTSPREYIGIDIQKGKNVDLILPAEKIIDYFGEESFDVIITTELLEHVKNWQLVIDNMKRALRKDGAIYITTRSYGFRYHAYPFDYWRYEKKDMENIFSDFTILEIKIQQENSGIFVKAKKTKNHVVTQKIPLYSIATGKRTAKNSELTLKRKGLLALRKCKLVKTVI